MRELADQITFSYFCSVLDELRRSNNEQEKGKVLKTFYNECRKKCGEEEDEFLRQLEPFILLFLPDSNDKLRFDIGYKKLADLIAKVLDIPGLRAEISKDKGRVTEILANEVSSRLSNENSEFSVKEFYSLAENLSNAKGDEKGEYLLKIIEKCNERELVWCFNVMIRNVESYAGYSRRSFLSHLSPNANSSWHRTRDLRSVLLNKYDDDEREPDFYLGCNFSPMLLARLTVDTIDKQMRHLNGGFFIETKYDGEHVLLHKKGNEYKWFTRNGKNFTENYGSTKDQKLAAQIHPVFKSYVDECILDCELMHFDESAKTLVRHLDKASDGIVLKYSDPQPGHRIVVVVFDMLYFGGHHNGQFYKEDLTITPLVDRVEIMSDRLLKANVMDNIFIAPRNEGETADDIRDAFKKAMENKEEGIAIKRKDSLYFVGKRNKSNGWFKLKDRFDMDLVMVGIVPPKDDRGYSFLLAAWDETSYSNKYLHVICKSYSGLSDMDRKQIFTEVRKNGPLLKTPPDGLIGWTDETLEYFRKSDWIVVEASSYGVRNGHLVDTVMRRIRVDKDICKEDIDEYRVIKKYNPAEIDFGTSKTKSEPVAKKRTTMKSVFSEGAAPETKREKIEQQCTCYAGKNVCVLQSFDDNLRKKCWSILEMFGVKVVANPNDATVALVAPSENHMKVKAAIQKNTLPIIKAEWLLRCERNQTLEKWLEADFIHVALIDFSECWVSGHQY